MKISQNFVALSEYMNFTIFSASGGYRSYLPTVLCTGYRSSSDSCTVTVTDAEFSVKGIYPKFYKYLLYTLPQSYLELVYAILKNGILLPKLFWPTVRQNSDWEKILKFEAEGQEFAKFLRSMEQFIQTVKGQNNFW